MADHIALAVHQEDPQEEGLNTQQRFKIEQNRRTAQERLASSRSRSRCCGCCNTGKCTRCSCVKQNRVCDNCVPIRLGQCMNMKVNDLPQLSGSSNRNNSNNNNESNSNDALCGEPSTNGTVERDSSFGSQKMVEAFGVSLIGSHGGNVDDVWYQRWKKMVAIKCVQYDLPGGSVGRHFVDMLANEINHLSHGLERSERLLVFLSVILQRDYSVKKGSDIRRLLKRRLSMWSDGLIDELVEEKLLCSKRFVNVSKLDKDKDHIIKVFTRLMWRGQIRSAVRWVTKRFSSGGVLDPTSMYDHERSVLDLMKEKHPFPNQINEDAFISCDSLPFLTEVDVTSAHIEKVARMISGGAGPGGSAAVQWRDFLLRYGNHSCQLREAMAELARYLANNIVEWVDIRALMACRLIALDKCPGVRPIGIGEAPRRILGKVLAMATRADVEEVCGVSQLCSGIKCGMEGAIHCINEIFDEKVNSGWGVLLVDAKNAFNSISREAALWNSRVLWPRCSRFLFNTYRGYAALVVHGSDEFLYSRDGVIQGDPLSMLLYAIGLLPLIRSLDNLKRVQSWYADDSACVAQLSDLQSWFKKLSDMGPKYGYFPEARKSVLVVGEKDFSLAEEVIGSLGVKIVTGHRFLGGFVGSSELRNEYVKTKIDTWIKSIGILSEVAVSQPQAAYTALSQSVQFEWSFLSRVISNCDFVFESIVDEINKNFWPSVFGSNVSELEKSLFALPIMMGGLGVRNPVDQASRAFQCSRSSCDVIVSALKGFGVYSLGDHLSRVFESQANFRQQQKVIDHEVLDSVLQLMSPHQKRSVDRSIRGKTGIWLSVLPLTKDNFVLSDMEFRDALTLRYNKSLMKVPSLCDGCGSSFTLTHALDCRKGGLVTQRHNEIRDTLGDLAALGFKEVLREPVVREADDTNGKTALFADLGVRGIWQRQTLALFDVRVIDTDAKSYVSRTFESVLSQAENDKKKYVDASEERRATFTPLVMSVDGALGREANYLVKRLADHLSSRWEKPCSVVTKWIRATLQFATIRATDLCIRGARSKWKGVKNSSRSDDGAGLPFIPVDDD